ncbi:MAG: YgjP-like metallopeptidase domain-containing protein, partial [Bacteroidota bacterium]|nr:YgjP-like metallopeptidase domain-containing protein [Bacteroidota bacterium]
MNYHIDEIIKSKRKTISIQVNEQGKLIIKAPKNISKKELEALINQHRLWIDKRVKFYSQNKFYPKKFKENEKFLFLGEEYNLKFNENYSSPYIFEEKIFI